MSAVEGGAQGIDLGAADRFADELLDLYGDRAEEELEAILARLSTQALAALAYDWTWWARSKQLPPDGDWLSWGFLGARGFGKTISIAHFINFEVEAGRAPTVGLAATKETRTVEVQVNSLIEYAPPWFKPVFYQSRGGGTLVWPNGAKALVCTPEVPSGIEGDNYYIFWMCELQSWPEATMDVAFRNVWLSTRKGASRVVWDATPEAGHPLLLQLMAQAEQHPETHRILLGLDVRENRGNLGKGHIENLEALMGGTAEGDKKLRGIMPTGKDEATAQQAWIDQYRAPAPARFARRVLALDPASTARQGSDDTGLMEGGLLHDGRVCVLGDHTRKYPQASWGREALRLYVAGGCDLILAETNKGGDMVVQNLRAEAILAESWLGSRLSIVVVKEDWIPQRVPGVVFVREIYSSHTKTERALPMGTPYQKGRMFHAAGVDLSKAEKQLTTWVAVRGKRNRSPNQLDALTMLAIELLGLDSAGVDMKSGFVGLGAMTAKLATVTNTQSPAPGMGGAIAVGARAFVGPQHLNDRVTGNRL